MSRGRWHEGARRGNGGCGRGILLPDPFRVSYCVEHWGLCRQLGQFGLGEGFLEVAHGVGVAVAGGDTADPLMEGQSEGQINVDVKRPGDRGS
jgi:hypothetical protein